MSDNGSDTTLRDRLRRLLRRDDPEAKLRESLEETIEEIIEGGEATPVEIGAQERVLIANVFKLRERTAYDVMIPRADIVAVPHDVTLPALVDIIRREAHSRYPVHRGTVDEIVGMVHIKDVLSYWGSEKPFAIDDVMRKLLFVAPSMRVLDLLLEMRKTRLHMALVVDEYGGIDGLVSIEDLVESIVGEIDDEHDTDEAPRVLKLNDGAWMIDARLPLDDFESEVGAVRTDAERDADIDTVGGLVVALAGRVPARGEVITHPAGVEFEVVEADPRRLKRLRVRRPEPPKTEAPEAA
ncbi:MAG: HlyC/CorC family transporter [Alphaproteobacteria bacterium]|nr:HlyC/CorC family transporter [Alphaproteobacteria bacterium]